MAKNVIVYVGGGEHYPQEWSEIIIALRSDRGIVKIMWQSGIGHQRAAELSLALEKGPASATLTTLCIPNCSIESSGAIALLRVLNKLSVTTLDLSGNKISDEAIMALAAMLNANDSITTLDLRNNRIGDDGCTGLAEMLKTNKSITTLNLAYNNQITDIGVCALADALLSNRTLASLNLWKCFAITNVGVSRVCSALKSNTTITTLKISPADRKSIPIPPDLEDSLERNVAEVVKIIMDSIVGQEFVLAKKMLLINKAALNAHKDLFLSGTACHNPLVLDGRSSVVATSADESQEIGVGYEAFLDELLDIYGIEEGMLKHVSAALSARNLYWIKTIATHLCHDTGSPDDSNTINTIARCFEQSHGAMSVDDAAAEIIDLIGRSLHLDSLPGME